jgi:hypothetical protein
MRSLLFRLFLIAFLALTFVPALPAPASALNVSVHCWCQDETTRTCNHYTIDTGIPETDTSWTELGLAIVRDPSYGAVLAGQKTVEELLTLPEIAASGSALRDRCRQRCREDGGKSAIHFETTYRGEICNECNADPNSSCTEARGARLAFGDAAVEQQIAACEDRQAKAALLPMKLAVPIGGIDQVAGLADYINVAYRYLVTVVLVVAIVMVVYGGFRYLVGASIGDIQAGKKIIVDAIVGMLIVLGAYTILSTVNPNTVILSFTPPEPVECRDLELPEAIKNSRCASDSECGEGRRCVAGVNYVFSVEKVGEATETGAGAGRELGSFVGEDRGVAANILTGGIVWALIPAEARKAASEAVGETIGGHVGTELGIASEIVRDVRDVRVCSTGEKGSPCLETVHCDARFGSCIDSWKICWTTSGNQPGEPCDSDAQCENGRCVAVAPEGWTSIAAGAPNPSFPYKVCEIRIENGTNCFRPNDGASATIFPIGCSGPPSPTGFVCAWCPPGTGGEARVWTQLNIGQAFPAQCKPRDAVGTNCAP